MAICKGSVEWLYVKVAQNGYISLSLMLSVFSFTLDESVIFIISCYMHIYKYVHIC